MEEKKLCSVKKQECHYRHLIDMLSLRIEELERAVVRISGDKESEQVQRVMDTSRIFEALR